MQQMELSELKHFLGTEKLDKQMLRCALKMVHVPYSRIPQILRKHAIAFLCFSAHGNEASL